MLTPVETNPVFMTFTLTDESSCENLYDNDDDGVFQNSFYVTSIFDV